MLSEKNWIITNTQEAMDIQRKHSRKKRDDNGCVHIKEDKPYSNKMVLNNNKNNELF